MPVDGYLNFDTKIDTDGFEGGIKDINGHVKSFESTLGKVGKQIKTAFNVAAVVTFGKKLVESAADVKAAGAQFEQTFGEMQDAAQAAIDRVADPADILAERLRGSATQIFAFAKTAKMESTTALKFMEDALQVAADSAAYYDRSIEDTTATLQSFLKGNYANDAALGLSATETTRNAKAMELYGKKFIELSEAQKQLTLLEMVKEANALSGAMGQAAREADGWANVTGNLSAVWDKFLGVIGQPVLQMMVPVIQQITAALERLTGWALTAYNAMAKVFGWGEKQVEPIEQAVAAQGKVTEAVEETEEAQEGSLASFDEIEVLASNTAKATEQTANAAAQNIAAATVTETAPAEEMVVDTSWVDGFIRKLQELKNFIDQHIKPAISTIGDGFEIAVQKISSWIDTVLKPKLAEIGEKYSISFDAIIPDNIGEMFEPIGKWFTEELPKMFEMVGTTLVNMLDPLGAWFTSDLPGFVESGMKFVSTAIHGLLDTFQMVFSDVWKLVIDPFLMTFAENILPVFTQLGAQLFDALTVAFVEVKRAFDMVWTDAVKPVLEFIGKAWGDLWALIQEKWEQWGKPIFDGVREAWQNTGDMFKHVWSTIVKPVWDEFMAAINRIWQEHLLPFVSAFMDFIGKLILGATQIYNEFITPLITWLTTELGPIITQEFSGIIATVEAVFSKIVEFATGFIESAQGVIDFFVGVFTADWQKAWDGIKTYQEGLMESLRSIIYAVLNVIIGLVNKMIRGTINKFNTVVDSINDMIEIANRALRWLGLPGIDFRVPKIPVPQIPYLAEGAVIPPNREFLAVLGDQKSGTNIETPLETMLDAFRTALRENGGGHGQQTIILTIDKRELGRVIVDAGSEEERRIGLRLVTT